MKFTKGPLFVVQPDKWPFNIEIVDTAGELVFEERRHSYSTSHKTVEDVMNCVGFHNTRDGPEFADRAIAANERQLADAYLRAAAPDLFEALRLMISDDFPSLPLTVQALRLELADAALRKATGVPTEPNLGS
jgi:hypothetical protein